MRGLIAHEWESRHHIPLQTGKLAPMASWSSRRGILIITLGVCLFVLFLALGTLNAFNLQFLNPASPIQTLVFITLSVLAFLLFVGVLFLLFRNVLKLYADQRSRILGTRLRTRMLWGAVLVSIVPLVFMFAFSYLLMNRAVDRWFSQPVTQMREDADNMAVELFRYAAANARSEADSIAIQLADSPVGSGSRVSPAALAEANRVLRNHELTLQGGFVLVYRDGHAVLPRCTSRASPPAKPRSRACNLRTPPRMRTPINLLLSSRPRCRARSSRIS
jgi:two-component system nitrogen regulation sensor histidine kinase NtrY